MASDPEFVDYIKEQLAPLPVSSARMFSGTGFSAHGVQFAMLIRNVLYFVVDDTTRPRYEAWGCECFSYETKKRHVDVRRYYSAPADALEDRERLFELAREAIAIARRSPAPGSRRRA